MRPGLSLSLAVALAATIAGCQMKPGEPAGIAVDGVEAWRPRPVSIRVYPSTRFVQDGDQWLLEARLELSDEMGDPLKAPGAFRLELYSDDTGQQLYAWRVRALTLEEQRTFYDPITRTYLMRLKLDAAVIADGSPRLRVGFTSADGTRLQAEADLRSGPAQRE